jgi:hypothetical protein
VIRVRVREDDRVERALRDHACERARDLRGCFGRPGVDEHRVVIGRRDERGVALTDVEERDGERRCFALI